MTKAEKKAAKKARKAAKKAAKRAAKEARKASATKGSWRVLVDGPRYRIAAGLDEALMATIILQGTGAVLAHLAQNDPKHHRKLVKKLRKLKVSIENASCLNYPGPQDINRRCVFGSFRGKTIKIAGARALAHVYNVLQHELGHAAGYKSEDGANKVDAGGGNL